MVCVVSPALRALLDLPAPPDLPALLEAPLDPPDPPDLPAPPAPLALPEVVRAGSLLRYLCVSPEP